MPKAFAWLGKKTAFTFNLSGFSCLQPLSFQKLASVVSFYGAPKLTNVVKGCQTVQKYH